MRTIKNQIFSLFLILDDYYVEKDSLVIKTMTLKNLQDKIISLNSNDDDQVIVIAHRGGYLNDWELKTPENSLKNIEKAIGLNFDMIEMDVCRSIDGQFVLMHDSKLGKRTSGSGHTYEKTWEEMSTYKLNYNNGVESNESMTLFSDVLDLIKNKMLIKFHRKFDVEYLPEIFELLNKYKVQDHIVFWEDWNPGEKEHEERQALFRKKPSYQEFQFLLTVEEELDLEPILQTCHVVAIELPFTNLDASVLSESYLEKILSCGVRLSSNTQNKPDRVAGLNDRISLENPDNGWGKILDYGFSMIQTDYPELFRGYINQR